MASPAAKAWTQTLVTGFSNKTFPRHRSGGFTLIELLVVVVILAVVLASGLSLLRYGVNERRIQQEGLRLQSVLDFLCEQSLLQNRPHGLAFASGGYAAVRAPSLAVSILSGAPVATAGTPANSPWLPVASAGLQQSEWALPEGLQLRVTVNGRLLSLTEKWPITPHLVCDSSGQLPAFIIHLQHPELSADYVLQYQPSAPVAGSLAGVKPQVAAGSDSQRPGWAVRWQEADQ